MSKGNVNISVNIEMGELTKKIAKIKDEIVTDIKVIRERDPAASSDLEVALLYSGFHAVLAYRLSHMLYQKNMRFAARLISQGARFLTGIEIHPGAKIGRGLFIDHGSAVVIGETAEIGDNCTLYQGVTLGGTGKHIGKRHPTLGNNVMVGSGAKVLGIPARIVRRNNQKVECDLDQVHIPDPVAQELCRLTIKLEALEKRLAELEGEEKAD